MKNLRLYYLSIFGPWLGMIALYGLNVIEAQILIPIFIFYYFIFRPIVDFKRLYVLGLVEPEDKFKLLKLIRLRLEYYDELMSEDKS